MKNRVVWVDIAKGICIFTVIFAHCIENPYNNLYMNSIYMTLICSFIMPMFFLISGFVFSIRKYTSLKEFILDKTKRILIPMWVFAGILIFFHFIQFVVLKTDGNFFTNLFTTKGIVNTLLMTRNSMVSGLWFLSAMYAVYLIGYCYLHFLSNNKWLFSVSALVFLLALIWKECGNFALPCCMEVAFAGQFFFIIGYLLRSNEKMQKIITLKKAIFLTAIIWLGGNMISYYILKETPVAFNMLKLNNVVLFMINSISGSALMIGLCMHIKSSKIVSSWGTNSLLFYGLHYIPLNVYELFVNKIFTGAGFLVHMCAAFAGAIGISLGLMLCINFWEIAKVKRVAINSLNS